MFAVLPQQVAHADAERRLRSFFRRERFLYGA
jgi:hypothetical protein